MKKRIRQLVRTHNLINPEQAIVIAVSGGSDSIALLHLLSELYPDNKRIAVYIDHGLRPLETPVEKSLVKTTAQTCSATFVSLVIDVERTQKEYGYSLEEACRKLRYRELENIRIQYNAQVIAVGHTSDDQAEEVLLRLIRGSGSTGLSGMAIRNGYIIRPLLHEPKKTLREYLKNKNISYCEDSSNTDLRFLRNRIRHKLLPDLEQHYNGSMRTTLIQTAAILDEENKLLTDITNTVFQKICTVASDKTTVDLNAISSEPVAIKRRIFEKICWKMAARPNYKQITSLLNLIHLPSGSEIHLEKGLRVLKQRECILFCYPVNQKGYRGSAVLPKSFPTLTIPSPGTYSVPELGYQLTIRKTKCNKAFPAETAIQIVDESTLVFPLHLRHHHNGETFQPLGNPGSKKIARFLTDQKVASTEKVHHPVLLSGNRVIAVLGLRIDNRCRIQADSTRCLQLHWKKL